MLDVHDNLGDLIKKYYFLDFIEKYGFTLEIHIDNNEIKTFPVYHANISIQDIISN